MLPEPWLWVGCCAARHSCIAEREQNSLPDADLADKQTEGPEEASDTNSEQREGRPEEVMSKVGRVKVRTERGTVSWRDTWVPSGARGKRSPNVPKSTYSGWVIECKRWKGEWKLISRETG